MIPPTPTVHYRAVFLSPHLDDVVFSCAGEILRLVQEGPVCVINIFTKYGVGSDHAAIHLGEDRYQEEADAAEYLGYSFYRLDETDAFFRSKRYQKIGNIFKRSSPEERDNENDVIDRILLALKEISYDALYVPLGVGWHVDHLMTHQAGVVRTAQSKGVAVLFYEDAPYCLIEGLLTARLVQLGYYPLSWMAFIKCYGKLIRSFWSTGMMQNSMTSKVLKFLSYPAVCVYFARTLWGHLKGWPVMTYQITPGVIDITENESRKFQAVQLYKSQVKTLFCGADDIVHRYRQYAEKIGSKGRLYERYWRFDTRINEMHEGAQEKGAFKTNLF